MSRDYRPVIMIDGKPRFRQGRSVNVNVYGIEFWGRVFKELALPISAEGPLVGMLKHDYTQNDLSALHHFASHPEFGTMLRAAVLKIEKEMDPTSQFTIETVDVADFVVFFAWSHDPTVKAIASDYCARYLPHDDDEAKPTPAAPQPQEKWKPNPDGSITLGQMGLVTALWNEIARQHPGITVQAPRLMNATVDAMNSIVAEWGKPAKPATPGMSIDEWKHCDEVGRSSEYLCNVLFGITDADIWENQAHPADDEDFDRCIKMLDCIPNARAKFELLRLNPTAGDLTRIPDAWRGLLAGWNDLERLYREGHLNELNALLRNNTVNSIPSEPA